MRPSHGILNGSIGLSNNNWSRSCDEGLAELIREEGYYYWARVQAMFAEVIGNSAWLQFCEEAKGLKDAGQIPHVHYNIPLHYARRLIESRGWLVPNPPELICRICHKPFNLASHILSTVVHFSARRVIEAPFCPDCYAAGCSDRPDFPRSPAGRRIALKLLSDLTAALGFVPRKDFKRREFMSRVPTERIIATLTVTREMPGPNYYEHCWRHWIVALIAAEVLDKEARPTGRGTQCLAQDGHLCFSFAEKRIDDWLTEHRVRHTKEPHYPRHPIHNPNGQRRADWLVGEFYLELFGLTGDPEYDRRVKQKRLLAQAVGLKTIELTYDDMADPTEKLGFLSPAIPLPEKETEFPPLGGAR